MTVPGLFHRWFFVTRDISMYEASYSYRYDIIFLFVGKIITRKCSFIATQVLFL